VHPHLLWQELLMGHGHSIPGIWRRWLLHKIWLVKNSHLPGHEPVLASLLVMVSINVKLYHCARCEFRSGILVLR